MPDYNNDGRIDQYDRELEEIFLEDDERALQEMSENVSGRGTGWAFFIVAVVMFFIFCVIQNKLGMH